MTGWDERYAACPDLFGDQPSPLLLEYQSHFLAGMRALAVGDGEGRNGVWLARRGLAVLSLDLSAIALERARQRAAAAGVALQTLCTDALLWEWPPAAFDLVTLVFVHLPAAQRRQLHASILRALRPGGLLLIEAFHRDQVDCGSGGPQDPDLLYGVDEIARDFADLVPLKLARVQTEVVLAGEPRGAGAAVHFVGRKQSAWD